VAKRLEGYLPTLYTAPTPSSRKSASRPARSPGKHRRDPSTTGQRGLISTTGFHPDESFAWQAADGRADESRIGHELEVRRGRDRDKARRTTRCGLRGTGRADDNPLPQSPAHGRVHRRRWPIPYSRRGRRVPAGVDPPALQVGRRSTHRRAVSATATWWVPARRCPSTPDGTQMVTIDQIMVTGDDDPASVDQAGAAVARRPCAPPAGSAEPGRLRVLRTEGGRSASRPSTGTAVDRRRRRVDGCTHRSARRPIGTRDPGRGHYHITSSAAMRADRGDRGQGRRAMAPARGRSNTVHRPSTHRGTVRQYDRAATRPKYPGRLPSLSEPRRR